MKEGEKIGKDFDRTVIRTKRIWIIPLQASSSLLPTINTDIITQISHYADNSRTCIVLNTNTEGTRVIIKNPHAVLFEYIHPRSPLINDASTIILYRVLTTSQRI